jgi:hypothetical protein
MNKDYKKEYDKVMEHYNKYFSPVDYEDGENIYIEWNCLKKETRLIRMMENLRKEHIMKREYSHVILEIKQKQRKGVKGFLSMIDKLYLYLNSIHHIC